MEEQEPRKRHRELIQTLTTLGPDHLSDFELLILAFGGCVSVSRAEDCAREFERELGPASTVEFLDFVELTWIKGINEAKAAAIVAGVELGRRTPLPYREEARRIAARAAERRGRSPG
jgi:DNA repair protein RadC